MDLVPYLAGDYRHCQAVCSAYQEIVYISLIRNPEAQKQTEIAQIMTELMQMS